MRYFENGDILLSDVDGVLIDSQKRFLEDMGSETALDKWMDYLESINWREFLRECEFMPDALDTFHKLQDLKILKGFITRIHSFREGKEKSVFLREIGLYVPLYYVLPEQPKSDVYIPNRKVVLLDDDEKNCDEWFLNGGKSILYGHDTKNCEKKYVKNLSDLLK